MSDVKRYDVKGSWVDDTSITWAKASMVMASDFDALRAELDAANKDAARYRWLRERTDKTAPVGVWLESDGVAIEGGWLCEKELDEEIDAAMKEQKP